MFEAQNPIPARPVWQVGALARAIADALTARFGVVSVSGELSGFSRATSGHCYFALKDDSGQLRCALFKSSAQRLTFEPRDGDAVELRARIDVYAPRGDMQLIVESMRRAGQGTLFEQFERLKAALQAQGLFEADRKRPLPARPRAIGVVTSLGAAALHDVLTALARRVPHIPVIVSPASVQGEGASAQLCTALQKLYLLTQQTRGLEAQNPLLAADHAGATRADLPPVVGAELAPIVSKGSAPARSVPPIDVILLIRGGGSLEDLWAFNNEQLAHTIVQSPVPIISGVGHETDFSIADFCADLRAPTPTAAAELCATPRYELLGDLQQLAQRVRQAPTRRTQQEAQRLDRMGWRLQRPAANLAAQRQRLERLAQRLQTAPQQLLRRKFEAFSPLAGVFAAQTATHLIANKHRLDQLQTRLQAASHERTLARGYAMLTSEAGAPITSATVLQVGQGVQVQLRDGQAHARVDSVVPAPAGTY